MQNLKSMFCVDGYCSLNVGVERDSLTVSTLACHAADPGSNPAQGNDFIN